METNRTGPGQERKCSGIENEFFRTAKWVFIDLLVDL